MALGKVQKSSGVFHVWDDGLHVGDIFNVSHNTSGYNRTHSTTASAITAQNVDSGIRILNQSATSSDWNAQVACDREGLHRYELKTTYADGSIQTLEFEVVVKDL